MKHHDAIIVGGGIIGLSLAIALHKRGLKPLIIERGEPGREASHAAGGMLADQDFPVDSPLYPLARASAALYPEFAHQLQDESGINVDLREDGTIVLHPSKSPGEPQARSTGEVSQMEPGLIISQADAVYLPERSVDPRLLVEAALGAAKHRGIDLVTGSPVAGIDAAGGLLRVRTSRAIYTATSVINCAGAWAAHFSPQPLPTRPVKGQMLSIVGVPAGALRHVIRSPDAYLIPRSDGRILIGATVEEAGYDTRTDPDTIKALYQAAVKLVPALSQGKIHEAWAGLRPGTPDDLPLLGATAMSGYFAATGHFRDGILLAPVTAQVISALIAGETPAYDLARFSPLRFAS